MANPERRNRGRQKVAMVRMERDSNRLVTFSKRRSGLFKKASEICTLTGSEAAVVVFSPGKKPFSFGHPSVDSIIDRFMGVNLSLNQAENRGRQPATKPGTKTENQIDEKINGVNEVNQKLTLVNSRVEAEKKRAEDLAKKRDSILKNSPVSWGLDYNDEEVELSQLKLLMESINVLKKNLHQHGESLKDTKDNVVPLVRAPTIEGFFYGFPLNLMEGKAFNYEGKTLNYGGQSSMILQNPIDFPTLPMIPPPLPMSNPYYFEPNLSYPFASGGHGESSQETSMNLGGNYPISFTALLMGSSSDDALNLGVNPSPFDTQDGFGFGFKPGFY